jgi:hypothetical protein
VMGMDETEVGEFACEFPQISPYEFLNEPRLTDTTDDYVEVSRDVLHAVEHSHVPTHRDTPSSDGETNFEKPADPSAL